MHASFRRLVCSGVLSLLLASVIPAQEKAARPPADAPAAAPDDVLAKGKGVTITRQELDEVYARVETGLMNAGQLLAADRREVFQAQLLDQLIFMRLCEARATAADQTRARFESDAFVRGLKDRLKDEAAYQKQLARAGYSEERFLKDKFLEALTATVVDREVKSKIVVPDEQLKQSYEDRPDRWNKPDSARVVQLLISTRDLGTGQELSDEAKKEKLKTIQSLRERIEKGEDIGALAKQFSDDTASKARNGALAFVRGQMLLEFEAATFSMKPGQLSDVVTTQQGYHLIKLLEKTPAMRRPIEEVQATIREELVAKELGQRLPDYSAQLRKEAGLELTASAPKASAPAPVK